MIVPEVIQEQVRTIVTLLMTRPITEEIALQVGEIAGFEHLEIVDGGWVGIHEELAEDMTGEEHSWIETLLLTALTNWVLQHKAGRVYPGDMDFVLDGEPGNVRLKRKPDVSFVPLDQVQATSGYYYGAPALVIEIKSPSQSKKEMQDKLYEYLQYGTTQAWLVLPDEKQIHIYGQDADPRFYQIGDMISGGDLLPGFTLDVSKVFDA